MAADHGQSVARVSGVGRVDQCLLPNGSCAFRHLSAGATAPTCGCRRFWLDTGHAATGDGERAWCFCGHHACFHDFAGGSAQHHAHAHAHAQLLANGPAGGADAEQPTRPQSQQNAFIAPTWSELIREPVMPSSGAGVQNNETTNSSTTGLGIRNASQTDSINLRLWNALNAFARQQDGSHASSNLPSTAVPSVAEGEGAPARHTSAHVQPRAMGPPLHIPHDPFTANPNGQYSATELATPSVQSRTPDFRAATALPSIARPSTPLNQPRRALSIGDAAPTAREEAPTVPDDDNCRRRPGRPLSAGPSLSIQEMCNTIENYGRRLSLLENISFNHLPCDEVHDQFQLMDGRVLDLEQWRAEQENHHNHDDTEEQIQAANDRLDDLENWRTEYLAAQLGDQSDSPEASSSRRKRLLPDASSFESDGSIDLNAAAHTEAMVLAAIAASAETGPRIDALESRLSELEGAALPSFARPWSVQIVLLPFGRNLPGVWFTSEQSTQHSMRSAIHTSEDWPAALEAPKTSFRSEGADGAWTTTSIEAWANSTQDEWLSPKACGPTGTVFQRLASRGFVHDVEFFSPDAAHILSVVSEAFDGVLSDQTSVPGAMLEKYHGLRERFIPLRKIRKSSRLRFLAPPEMVTPTAWTAEFLESSVFMKSNGERRLYLTSPDGYLQPPQSGWNWQTLRTLPLYDADGELQDAQNAGGIVEACWSYNDRLDTAMSLHSSFEGAGSPWHHRPTSQEPEHVDRDADDAMSRNAVPQHHDCSVSLASAASVQIIGCNTLPKRRVASFEARSPSKEQEERAQYVFKRRRISSSPELDRRGYNLTPRYSREPPSPFTSDEIGPGRGSQAASSRARGTTPFAYATPHSHFDSRGGDGETEADDDLPLAQSENGDWEGLPDGPTTSPVSSEGSRNQAVIGNRIDEEGPEQDFTVDEG
ncbi:uncharacterized protein MYCFIDRAFT_215990 [Pseudocercospora fijiensis CIRAD86]|uniref:Uncharacterized protein n=1 Tax=Pseudocercospora fijiensis (strain CIRAD86) TaxID=383855 RepID=M3AA80_PSEFD|nr:uncharacterized protein MYCFIDRAFT_215990 [Pseudocercospora fijiensis CIRAD86]EME81526.1 hypothetical protein MYCFIDRAFT_215990 [Pseudocercospora fijiensis CIRAD86]